MPAQSRRTRRSSIQSQTQRNSRQCLTAHARDDDSEPRIAEDAEEPTPESDTQARDDSQLPREGAVAVFSCHEGAGARVRQPDRREQGLQFARIREKRCLPSCEARLFNDAGSAALLGGQQCALMKGAARGHHLREAVEFVAWAIEHENARCDVARGLCASISSRARICASGTFFLSGEVNIFELFRERPEDVQFCCVRVCVP